MCNRWLKRKTTTKKRKTATHHASTRGRKKNLRTLPLHALGGDAPSQTASHELLPSLQVCHVWVCLKEQMCEALKASEKSLDQSSRMWHLVNSWRDELSCCSSSGQWFVNGRNTQRWVIWDLLHRWRVSGPSSGASAALLWAVTFVPEWIFDSFCVVVFFFFFFFLSVCWFVFPLDCVLSWHLTHCCQTGFFLKNLCSKGDVVPGTVIRQSDVGGKQESGEVNAPSCRFSSIHQLPRCAPKIKKIFYFPLRWAPAGLVWHLRPKIFFLKLHL